MANLCWGKSHMLTLRRKVVEGTWWQARHISTRSSYPHS
uniref:Flocculation protein FLO11 n=1 Tax=Rhizophora mucronata TaxID=61149 RepID=A0A2P2LZ40_RHIMU